MVRWSKRCEEFVNFLFKEGFGYWQIPKYPKNLWWVIQWKNNSGSDGYARRYARPMINEFVGGILEFYIKNASDSNARPNTRTTGSDSRNFYRKNFYTGTPARNHVGRVMIFEIFIWEIFVIGPRWKRPPDVKMTFAVKNSEIYFKTRATETPARKARTTGSDSRKFYRQSFLLWGWTIRPPESPPNG